MKAAQQEKKVRLVSVRHSEIDFLKDYISKLYRDDGDEEALVCLESGLQDLMKNPEIAIPYFIYLDEQRIGYVLLIRYPSVEKGGMILFIDELFVEPAHRGGGIGGVILDQIKELAKDLGVKTLWAQAEYYNEGAIHFFKKHGFKKNQHVNFEFPI